MAARVAITIPSTDSDPALIDALEVLVFANTLWLRRNPGTVALYGSGVRFRPEPFEGSGVELFQTIPEVLAQGHGDCDDLAGWRCAELRSMGVNARCDIQRVRPLYHHAVVITPAGIEDPARVLKALEVKQWRSF